MLNKLLLVLLLLLLWCFGGSIQYKSRLTYLGNSMNAQTRDKVDWKLSLRLRTHISFIHVPDIAF